MSIYLFIYFDDFSVVFLTVLILICIVLIVLSVHDV